MNELYREVVRIAEELMEQAVEDGHGIYWKTLHREPYGEPYLQVNEELYNGTTGVVLFFNALYQYSGEARYLETALRGAQWLQAFSKQQPVRFYTFYSGFTGIVFLYIRLYESTGKKYWLEEALDLTLRLEDGIRTKVHVDDLLSGHAGNLFVVTYLYAYTKNESIAELVVFLLDKVVSGARVGRRGLKWGFNPHALDCLTGMSHGAGGIAHAILQVSHILRLPALEWIARQAFVYEDSYFSRDLQSWIDLRIPHRYMDDVQQLLNKDLRSFLRDNGEVNAWAHGTSGIGLARLGAYAMLGKRADRSSALKAVRKTLDDIAHKSLHHNYTICVGYGGWMELLLNGAMLLKQPALEKKALQLAGEALAFRREHGFYSSAWGSERPDPALLVGTAGIGYVFLRLLSPEKVDSILAPAIKAPQIKRPLPAHAIFSDTGALREKVLSRYYRRTIAVLETMGVQPDFVSLPDRRNGHLLLPWKQCLWLEITRLQPPQAAVAREIFLIESRRIRMEHSHKAHLYREVKNRWLGQKAVDMENWTTEDYTAHAFGLCTHVSWMPGNQWHWPEDDIDRCKLNVTAVPGLAPLLLQIAASRVKEYRPGTFSTQVMQCCRKGLGYEKIKACMEKLAGEPISGILQAQLVQMVKAGIIEPLPAIEKDSAQVINK